MGRLLALVWLLYGASLRGWSLFGITWSRGACPDCGDAVIIAAHKGQSIYWHQHNNMLVNH